MTQLRSLMLALPLAAFSGAAFAGAYSGNYMLTVTKSVPAAFEGATRCITLTDDGSLGWKHSGPATIANGSHMNMGQFEQVGHVLFATFLEKHSSLVLSATVMDRMVTTASFVAIENGTYKVDGIFKVGSKGSC